MEIRRKNATAEKGNLLPEGAERKGFDWGNSKDKQSGKVKGREWSIKSMAEVVNRQKDIYSIAMREK